jgi:DNA repair protein RadD
LTPRPFQARAMAAVGEKMRGGARAVLVVSPTGSGKTCMGSMMVARFVAQGKRVAWGAHREELLHQAARTLKSFGLEVGLRGMGASAPVQLGTFQEWVSRGSCPDADVFVPDEAHHMGDRVGWQKIPASYKAQGARIIGLTATPARGDGRALPDFDALVVASQIHELQAEGLLVPLRWRGPPHHLGSKAIAQSPVEAYLTEARGRCAVVFAPHVRAAEDYASGFQAAGVRVAIVTGNMPADARVNALQAHVDGALDVLVNVNVLTEGWDNPRCDTVITGRGCESAGLLIQMVGRGLRPFPGKRECLWLDLRGVVHQLGRPDSEATYSLEGEGIVLATDRSPTGERLCRVCRFPLGDALVCLACGKDHSPPVPKVAKVDLVDWQEGWDATRGEQRPSNVVLGLAGIMRKAELARAKGKPWKNGAIEMRFSFAFKRRPYPSEITAARNFLRAAMTYEPTQRKLGS